jgi:ESS family glutamate:Na+ symporter
MIEGESLSFFSNVFMELLIFSAITTMDLMVISGALIPLFILFTAGFIWNLYCHFVLRHKMLPKEYSMELSLINFGMLNGTTAIGLMLLRMIDPDLKSRGVKIYAEAAPFTSAFVGGGILTLSLPYLINTYGGTIILTLLVLSIILFYFIGRKAYQKIH